MAFSITYARLFGCEVRHDYFLNLGGGVRFNALDPAVPADATVLTSILAMYDLRELLAIRPLGGTARSLAGHRMKLVKDRLGFFVGVALSPGGTRPATVPSEGVAWQFGLYPRNPAEWDAVTNQRMRPNLPARYLFTNQRPGWTSGLPTAPPNPAPDDPTRIVPISLAIPAPARQRRAYAGGEVITEGGIRYRSLEDVPTDATPVTDRNIWAVEANVLGEATDADRCLLPARFVYHLTLEDSQAPTKLTINLRKISGGEAIPAKTIDLKPRAESVLFDFTKAKTPAWYDLVVTSNDSYATRHRVYLNDELYDPRLWGVVALGLPPTDPELRLLETDGRLRLNAAGNRELPVFQVRIPNRHTYWRYVAHPTQNFPAIDHTDPTDPNPGFDTDGQKRLVFNTPRPLTRFGEPLLLTGENGAVSLPIPGARGLSFGPDPDDKKLYSEQHLGVLDLSRP